ncbi:MAG: UDP-N-acetylmuramoyl-L-alanyl-D-glutamate--2,6-diaminopimelate ligase, partial [Spirochaetaceae bacterium]|nr:UDP-N-acetylmuramoyl-L-alanyl-D-glutamate--2,6-diaminopimelate ligase [Spirochaetaceae bacterium]
MERNLREICRGLELLECRGPLDVAIAGLAYDSRAVKPGYLFFALPGLHADGRRFIGPAIAAGAVAVIHEGELESYDPWIAYLRVPSSRYAMSPVAAAFFGHPSRS